MNLNLSNHPETLKLEPTRRFVGPCDLGFLRMTSKNNRAPLLYHFKLCVSFRSHLLIKTGVTVRKRSVWVKIVDFIGSGDLAVWRKQ